MLYPLDSLKNSCFWRVLSDKLLGNKASFKTIYPAYYKFGLGINIYTYTPAPTPVLYSAYLYMC